MEAAVAKISAAGAKVRTSVPLITLADLAEDEDAIDFDTLLGTDSVHTLYVSPTDRVVGAQYREVVDEYLADFESSPVRTMKDIVDFNKAHADLELPSGETYLTLS